MKIVIVIVCICILSISGCLSGGGSSDDSSSSGNNSNSNSNNNNTTRTLAGYAKGKLPAVYTPTSSAPSKVLPNPSEWLIKLTEVSDERTATPNNDGEFSIPIYTTDYLSTNTKIEVSKNGKVISGNTILESAVIYAVNSTDALIEPTISIGFFSNNTYTLFENSSDTSSLYSAWSKIASGDYSGASAEFTTLLGSTTSENTKASANAGLGWSKVKITNGKLSDGKSYFQLASTHNLGKIGLSYVYISETSNIMTSISHLESLGLSSTAGKYNEAEVVGISNQELYATLAYCYIYIGDYESASSLSNRFSGSSEDVANQVAKIITEFGIN